jgi:hypothetical protein
MKTPSSNYNSKQLKKLEEFMGSELQSLEDVIVIKDSSNKYFLFNHYTLTVEENNCTVVSHDLTHSFGSTQEAICWTIAHRVGDIALSSKILEYSNIVAGYQQQALNMQKMINKRKDPETLQAKLSQVLYNKHRFWAELNKYLNIAKYYQSRGIIKHETSRISPKANFKRSH